MIKVNDNTITYGATSISANIKGEIIFCKVAGSIGYNLNVVTSDVDFIGVYAADLYSLLGVSGCPETVTGDKPDYTIHEARKFCQLIVKGNPGIIDMLFSDKLTYETQYWRELKQIRHKLLSVRTIKQYLGYAQGQLMRLDAEKSIHSKGGVYNEKWAYHTIRLLIDAERIAKGEEPEIWKTGSDRDYLMDIRNGNIAKAAVVADAKARINRIDSIKPWNLPEEVDVSILDLWSWNLRNVMIKY